MRREDLFDMIGEADGRLVAAAGEAMKRRPRPAWFRWAGLAACLCLAAGLAIPILRLKTGLSQDTLLPPIHLIEYDGAYYEIILENRRVLDEFNLPREITAEMAGPALGRCPDPDGGPWTLRPYTPYGAVTAAVDGQERPQRAVYVAERDGEYAAALFCNFTGPKKWREAGELFAVYGVDGPEDIAGVTLGQKTVKDPAGIAEIFDSLTTAQAMGNDEFQTAVFRGKSEEDQQILHTELADSRVNIGFVTTEGLVCRQIAYYPTIGYVEWALSYYRMDRPIIY